MRDVTRILHAIEGGDRAAGEDLLVLVYDELRRLAAARLSREPPGQTLQATALVHEVYLRLLGAERMPRWDSRRHFFLAAAEAMRRLLINRARERRRFKRGGHMKRIDGEALDLDQLEAALGADEKELLALCEAVQRLQQEDPVCAELVKLRFFAGLKHADAARALDLPRRTADRLWAFARAWLFGELRRTDES